MTRLVTLAALLMGIAPLTSLAQTGPAGGVIFDDFDYQNAVYGHNETSPPGSVFGRNFWPEPQRAGGGDSSRAWYRVNWQEVSTESPGMAYEIDTSGQKALRLVAEAGSGPWPSKPQAPVLVSGFASRRGVWAARVNFSDLTPASQAGMI